MQFVLIIHEVDDFEAWKTVFDSASQLRLNAGERRYQVLRFDREPNKVVHFSEWTSAAEARQFFESPHVAAIRAEAGVKTPEFIYLDLVEAGTLSNEAQ